MQYILQIYKAHKHSISNQSNQVYFGGLHKPSSLLKKQNLSLLRGFVNTSTICLFVSIKFNVILFFPTSSLKKWCLISVFCPRMLNWILCQRNNTSVITKNRNTSKIYMVVLELVFKPQYLGSTATYCNILCFSSRKSNRVLLL